MSEKNVVSSALESLAVEFGVDGAYESVQEHGFLGAVEKGVQDTAQKIKETATGISDKAKEVGGYLKEDWNSLKTAVDDFFASDEEKAAKEEEEAAKKAAEEAEQKAREEAEAAMKAELDKSYILHTALITCDKAYTNEAINPSYIVLPQSHGVSIHGLPQLTINDYIADVNVLNFGICRSPENPGVQAAARKILDEVKEESKSWTDKLMGIFVDDSVDDVCSSEQSLAAYCAAPCTPEFDSGWIDGKDDVLIDGVPALLGKCTMSCVYGGNIQIHTSGQYEE